MENKIKSKSRKNNSVEDKEKEFLKKTLLKNIDKLNKITFGDDNLSTLHLDNGVIIDTMLTKEEVMEILNHKNSNTTLL